MVRKTVIAALFGLLLAFASGQAQADEYGAQLWQMDQGAMVTETKVAEKQLPVSAAERKAEKIAATAKVAEATRELGAKPIPADSGVVGSYKCTSALAEEAKKPESIYHDLANTTPEEGGRYWKSSLITQPCDAYSIKRPAGKATVTTAVMPASLPKFSKGVTWGIVAVSKKSGKIVRGKITPAGPDKKNGQQPSVVVFEEPVEAGSKLVASDRWYNNSFFNEKRGELAIWNPGTAKWEKLVGGMWLERDPKHMALVADTYGVELEQVRHATVSPTEAEQVSKKLGWKKVASPDGTRYTPVDLGVFKKIYAQPSLVRWPERFANNGGLAIGIPPTAVGTLMNVGVAAITATFDTSHNVPCLSTLKGGQSRFERDQRFYENGGAINSREFARAKTGIEADFLGSAKTGQAQAGQGGIEGILASIGPVSPSGYPQAYNWSGFWLEPKRVEWPNGAGIFRSPALDTEYAFSNTYLHLFGGEVAPNATLHWGPSHKIDYWRYCTSSGYPGRGHFYGVGGSTELVTRHKWGGSDDRFAVWYGYEQLDKGRSHSDSRHPWMFEWQTELWFAGLKLGKGGKYGSMFDGAKIGVLAKTNDFLLAWLFPVVYRSPYDIAKLSVGPQFLHFFSRDGDEPKGGGIGAQVEVLDGLGYRYSYFPFKKGMYHTGWFDSYRVYQKLRQLEAEFGIYEIPWDPYAPEIVPVKLTPVSAPKITCPPVVEKAPPVVKKKRPKKGKKLRKRCPVTQPEMPIDIPQLPNLEPTPAPKEVKPEQPTIIQDKPEQPAQAPNPVPDLPKVEQSVPSEIPDIKITIPSAPEDPKAEPTAPPAVPDEIKPQSEEKPPETQVVPPQAPAEVKQPDQPAILETPEQSAPAIPVPDDFKGGEFTPPETPENNPEKEKGVSLKKNDESDVMGGEVISLAPNPM